MQIADTIFAYEAGELDEAEVVDLFQELLDSGLVWSLQGHYGRSAVALLEQGLIRTPAVTEFSAWNPR